MLFNKKEFKPAEISTASMPDIIFMLLIFFMVTTTIRENRGLLVKIPDAENAKKVEGKRNIVSCFVDNGNRISLDDKLLTPAKLEEVIKTKIMNNKKLIVSLKADEAVKNDIIDQVHKSFQKAYALKIVYATRTK